MLVEAKGDRAIARILARSSRKSQRSRAKSLSYRRSSYRSFYRSGSQSVMSVLPGPLPTSEVYRAAWSRSDVVIPFILSVTAGQPISAQHPPRRAHTERLAGPVDRAARADLPQLTRQQ